MTSACARFQTYSWSQTRKKSLSATQECLIHRVTLFRALGLQSHQPSAPVHTAPNTARGQQRRAMLFGPAVMHLNTHANGRRACKTCGV